MWFRMNVGRRLYEAVCDEAKMKIDQRREQEKDDAVVARAVASMFTNEQERIELMKKFDE